MRVVMLAGVQDLFLEDRPAGRRQMLGHGPADHGRLDELRPGADYRQDFQLGSEGTRGSLPQNG